MAALHGQGWCSVERLTALRMSSIRSNMPLTFKLVRATPWKVGNRFGVKSCPNSSKEALEHKLYLKMDTRMPAAKPLHVQALFDELFNL